MFGASRSLASYLHQLHSASLCTHSHQVTRSGARAHTHLSHVVTSSHLASPASLPARSYHHSGTTAFQDTCLSLSRAKRGTCTTIRRLRVQVVLDTEVSAKASDILSIMARASATVRSARASGVKEEPASPNGITKHVEPRRRSARIVKLEEEEEQEDSTAQQEETPVKKRVAASAKVAKGQQTNGRKRKATTPASEDSAELVKEEEDEAEMNDSSARAAKRRGAKRIKSEDTEPAIKAETPNPKKRGGVRKSKNSNNNNNNNNIKDEDEEVDEEEEKKMTKAADDNISPSKAEALQARKLKSYSQYANKSPFPDFLRPTPEECKLAHKILAQIHGKRERPEEVVAPTNRAGCGDSNSVLDALVRTILSQNTSDKNSTRAKLNMDEVYGGSNNWEKIVEGGEGKLQKAIERGGLSVVKSRVITSILKETKEKYGVYSLDHLFDKSNEDAMTEMLAMKGVGPKTASCVLLFCLKRESFAVDTHVHRITGLLGWRPQGSSRDEAHAHLDARVPDEDKYGLHILLVTHGKKCEECKAGGRSTGKCELRKAFRGAKLKGEAGKEVKDDEEDEVKKEEEEN